MDKKEAKKPFFKPIKVSIQFSIITLFLFLLLTISTAIITTHYVILNQILTTSAKTNLEQNAILVEERVSRFIQSYDRDLTSIVHAIEQGIIDPDKKERFTDYLLSYLRHNPEVYMVYYGTEQGDFFAADREKAGVVAINYLLASQSPPSRIRIQLDEDHQPIAQKDIPPFEPRTRPWYIQAKDKKQPYWTDIYAFHEMDKGTTGSMGITLSQAVYDEHDRVKGVVGIDITMDTFQYYINQLYITPNAMLFISAANGKIVAFNHAHTKEDIRGKILSSDKISHYQAPPAALADKDKERLIHKYQQQGEEYYGAYQKIKVDAEDPWAVTIIVPADDILGPLKELSIKAFFITLAVLFLGTLLARYIAGRISLPIIQLTSEVKDITQLRLAPRPFIKTRIKEISDMNKNMALMRSSLMSFQRYVPHSLVKKLIRSGQLVQVGGNHQCISILFSDIKNFTQLAENSTPQELMQFLSDYFQTMTDAVITHQGTVDKYIGDAIMALWNAADKDPNHAYHACCTAVEMIERLTVLNQKNKACGRPQFTIRIGINSGDAIVGNVGSTDRLNFTALGDSVNLASRLEKINKSYQSEIIVSSTTYEQVKRHFPFRLLDEVAVRGKTKSTTIYQLVTGQATEQLAAHRLAFAKAFQLYQEGKWAQSLDLFRQLPPAYPGDTLASLYIERCESFLTSPPTDWNGIWYV
ncbi:MAG: adenylate/guanylate cyclase domain-containing protein [Legionellaceae bacterium]|nr:adenylate/guanylate cyclase domain-containing protein [Legionellaceae bacterium]